MLALNEATKLMDNNRFFPQVRTAMLSQIVTVAFLPDRLPTPPTAKEVAIAVKIIQGGGDAEAQKLQRVIASAAEVIFPQQSSAEEILKGLEDGTLSETLQGAIAQYWPVWIALQPDIPTEVV